MDQRRPPLGVRYRRVVREFRSADAPVRLLAMAVVAILLVDLASTGSVGSTGGHSRLASSGSGAPGSLTAGGSTGDGGTGTGPGTTTGSGASSTGGTSGGGTSPANATVGTPATSSPAAGGSTGGASLPASDRGVTSTTIKVVFPWPNLGTIGQLTGLDTSSEDPVMSIHTYVNDINDHGGILGRKIDPLIVSFNPLDDSDMRSKCLSWTKDQKVFAVVDSIGWHDANQLCITQEGHTPLISGWTTVPLYTSEGSPNLWWTGPDNARVVENLVAWAVGRGMLKPGTKLGVVAADRQGDTLAVNQYLLPALQRAGLPAPADIESMHFDSSDGADSASQAPLIVTRLRSKGVTTVIPLLPFLNLSAFASEAQQQNWQPTYLLSDYESTLTSALGLADSGNKQLDNQVGPTSYVLGTHDDTRGYTPQGLDCYKTWMKANPGATPPPQHWLEATGTAMTWCQNIRLFAEAARAAGPVLTRAGFDAAMAAISSFPGTVVPDHDFATGLHSGPHLYRTVQVHENGDGKCPTLASGKAQGSCWLVLPGGWQEMRNP